MIMNLNLGTSQVTLQKLFNSKKKEERNICVGTYFCIYIYQSVPVVKSSAFYEICKWDLLYAHRVKL